MATDRASGANGDPLRYGLIGSGQMGQGHIGAVQHVAGVGIVALADPFEPNRTRAAEAAGGGVRTYANHREMLSRESLDAVIVATPNATHADIVCDALEAGVHVLGEKPMATRLADCGRVVATSRRTGRIYQVGLELRCSAMLRRIHEMVSSGRIGPVRQLWFKEFRGPWALKVGQWITQASESGGTLLEKNCHHWDLFNWFTRQRPERVLGCGTRDLVYGAETFEGVTPDVLDNAQVIVQYADDSIATLLLNMYCAGFAEGHELGLIGREGWIIATLGATDRLRLVPRGGGEHLEMTFSLPDAIARVSHHGMVYFEHVAFRDNIRQGTPPLTDGLAGWWSVVVGLAAERAVRERRVVEISEFGPPPDGAT